MKRFSTEEDNFLKANYMLIPTKRMAKMLGRSEGTARQRLRVLGLTVPPEIVEQFKRDSRIKAGNVPMNKGKKLTEYCKPESIEAIKATQFPKGNLPRNTKYDGAISIRNDKRGIPFYHTRVSKAKWEYLHRYNYERFIGNIPPKHIVTFKDNNTLNCHPFNLQLMSMKENVIRNSIHRFPEELKQVIKLTTKLKKKIKNYGKEQIK